MLEAAVGPRWKPGEALAPESNPILDRLGLSAWLAGRSDIACRSAGVRSIWGTGEVFFRDGFREPLGAGWVIDRRGFESFLDARAIEAGSEWIWSARVQAAEWSKDIWRLRAIRQAASMELHARVIIDATGRPASIARRLGARRVQYQQQIASVISWQEVRPPDTAWVSVESTPDGWWYSVSGPNSSQLLAQFRDGSDAHAGRGDCCSSMEAALTSTQLMRQVVTLPPRQDLTHAEVVSAGSAALDSSAGEAWLAVGDAAAAFDPISSQGLSNAIASAYAGANAVHNWIRGDGGALKAYAASVTATYDNYRRGLRTHYRSETRWRDRPFWKRRHKE